MPRRTIAFIVFALAVAVGCVRLGVWQLARLRERLARNDEIALRLREAPVPIEVALRDSATARYRVVTVRGRYDYANELVFTSRTRNGAPGVNLLTPVIPDTGAARGGVGRSDGAPAVLVNRGWVYAPDGLRIDNPTWREGEAATVEGYLDAFAAGSGVVSTTSVARGVRRADRDSIAARIPYAVQPFIVVQRLGADQRTSGRLEHPSRLELPALDEGPHRSYAIQWFAFAAIAVIGAATIVRHERGRRT